MPKKKPPHTEQHFVPQAYLRPWLDTTSTPKGSRNAYGVWVFDRDGTNARQQSPKALFWEDDIYSIPMPDGTRDLRLEHGFGTLEDKYTRIRNRTLMRGLWPSAEETVSLLAFVFAAYFRTPGIRDHYGKQFGELRAMTQRVEQAHANRPARGWESVVGSPTAPRGWRVVPEEVDFMADYPIQAFMMPALSAALPMLGQMAMAVMQTDDELGFITTDAPCCWYDSEAYKLPPLMRGVGLASKTTTVTMPLSPNLCLLLSHDHRLSGFLPASPNFVLHINKLHISGCAGSFVACRNQTRREWFEMPPLPDDAWDSLHPGQVAETMADASA